MLTSTTILRGPQGNICWWRRCAANGARFAVHNKSWWNRYEQARSGIPVCIDSSV